MINIKIPLIVIFCVVSACSTQKDYDAQKMKILKEVATRITADSSTHQGIIESAKFFPTQLLSGEKENFGKVNGVFLVLKIANGECILLLDDNSLLPSPEGRKISYRYSIDAIDKWPFAVFDANKGCNPVVLYTSD